MNLVSPPANTKAEQSSPNTEPKAPPIRSWHMALYKCILIDWLIDSRGQKFGRLLAQNCMQLATSLAAIKQFSYNDFKHQQLKTHLLQ